MSASTHAHARPRTNVDEVIAHDAARAQLVAWWADALTPPLTKRDGVPLRVCALWQPWATLCVEPDPARAYQPAKQNETRHFEPNVRRRPLVMPVLAAICATRTMNADVRTTLAREPFASTLTRLGYWPGDPKRLYTTSSDSTDDAPSLNAVRGAGEYTLLKPLPLGAVVGLAVIAASIPAEDERARLHWIASDQLVPARDRDVARREMAFGHYGPGRFAWQLTHALPIPQPIPITGKQDVLYQLDASLVTDIRRQLDDVSIASQR